MKRYKLARLVNCEGDLSKRWYVIFYILDEATGKLARKRDYSINEGKTAKERNALAKQLIYQIDQMLKNGHTYNSQAVKTEETEIIYINQALKFIIKNKNLADYTITGYKQVVRVLENFEEHKNKKYKLTEYDKLYCLELCDFRRAQVGSSTMAQFISSIRTLFNEMVEREFVQTNYFKSIKKPKPQTERNVPYDDQTAKIILDYMKVKKPQLWLFCLTMYYTFMRVRELRHFKINWINWEREQIKIPSEFAKGRKKGRWVKIPKNLMKIYNELKINELDKDLYLFGLESPQIDLPKEDSYTDAHHWILRKLNLSGKNHTLYAWKHTGVIAAYRAGVDIKTIQHQCGHSNLQTTDVYLRNLGLLGINDSLDKMPEF